MKKTIVLAILLIIVTLIGSVAPSCARPAPAPAPAPAPVPAPTPVRTFRINLDAPTKDHPAYVLAAEFSERLANLSGGKLRADVFLGAQLGTPELAVELLSKGIIDFTCQYVSTSLDPRLDIFNVPGIGWTWEDAMKIYESPDYKALFTSIAAAQGWRVLALSPCCFNKGVSKKKFTPVPDQVKPLGLKCRSMMMKSDELTVNALGFKATPMPFAEVATSLMTGIIDAALGPASFDAPTFSGVTDYFYDYFYRVEISPFMISEKVWATLSANEQKMIEEAATAAAPGGWKLAADTENKFTAKLVSDYKYKEVIKLTEEQLIANTKAIREQVWPELDKLIGKDIMDKARALAKPLPK